jgi:hypothetical protein
MCAPEGAAAVGRTNDGKLAGKAMKDLCLAIRSTFANVRFVLTDMDETLTYRGQLSRQTAWPDQEPCLSWLPLCPPAEF